MSYATQEAAGGQPIELYVFTLGAETWRYTSSDAPVTIATGAAAGTYAPMVLSRGSIQGTDESTNGQLELTLGRDAEVPALFDFDRLVHGPLSLTVWRYHRADPDAELVTIFVGRVSSHAATADAVTLLCTPLEAVIQSTIPTDLMQPLCNNMLYDVRCGIDRALFKTSGTINNMALDGVRLTVTAAAAQPDGYFTGGYADAAGLQLAVIAHVGSLVTLVRRFPEGSVGVGTAIDLYAGCDRSSTTCSAKFANLVHFLGFPRMPKDDPFQTPMV